MEINTFRDTRGSLKIEKIGVQRQTFYQKPSTETKRALLVHHTDMVKGILNSDDHGPDRTILGKFVE